MLDMLPIAPDYKPLELSDQPVLAGMFDKFPPSSSEMTFSNLFAWSQTHPVFIARSGQALVFYRGPNQKGHLLPPAGLMTEKDVENAFLMAEKIGGVVEFGRVDEKTMKALQGVAPDLTLVEDRDNADYIYTQEGLSELAGRKLDGKRNLVKKFYKTVDATYQPIDRDLLNKCIEAQALWCDSRQCSIHADLEAENKAVGLLLEHWDDLPLVGGALCFEDRVLSFSIGEKLNPETAVVHVEKGDGSFKGVYQAMNQAFAQHGLKNYQFINREQDLGVEGMRKAKLSYQPHMLMDKFTLRY